SIAAIVSLRIASGGVPFGTHSPYHVEIYTPGAPASSTVGMSGAAANRLFEVTAYALTPPLRTCGRAVMALSDVRSLCPATRSRIISDEPARYGTNWKRVFVTS